VTPNSHFKELLSLLNRCEAKYLVIGGYAVMLYTEPRYTKDLDIWVEASSENADRVFRALAEFGAPLAGIQAGDFAKADLIYQLGVAPARIDVLTSITEVSFEDAWTRRKEAEFGDVHANFISLDDLLKNKQSTARLTDLVDCQRLEEAKGPR
jgi:hypothetical protein